MANTSAERDIDRAKSLRRLIKSVRDVGAKRNLEEAASRLENRASRKLNRIGRKRKKKAVASSAVS